VDSHLLAEAQEGLSNYMYRDKLEHLFKNPNPNPSLGLTGLP